MKHDYSFPATEHVNIDHQNFSSKYILQPGDVLVVDVPRVGIWLCVEKAMRDLPELRRMFNGFE